MFFFSLKNSIWIQYFIFSCTVTLDSLASLPFLIKTTTKNCFVRYIHCLTGRLLCSIICGSSASLTMRNGKSLSKSFGRRKTMAEKTIRPWLGKNYIYNTYNNLTYYPIWYTIYTTVGPIYFMSMFFFKFKGPISSENYSRKDSQIISIIIFIQLK